MLLQALADGGGDTDALQMIDSTIVRAHHCAAGVKVVRRLWHLTTAGVLDARAAPSVRFAAGPTKIHLHTNAHRLPINLSLTPGETHDSTVYGVLMKERDSDPGFLLADRGYDSDARCHPLRPRCQQLPQLCPRCLGFHHHSPRRGNVRHWPSVRLSACV
jgi:hypothetical protein